MLAKPLLELPFIERYVSAVFYTEFSTYFAVSISQKMSRKHLSWNNGYESPVHVPISVYRLSLLPDCFALSPIACWLFCVNTLPVGSLPRYQHVLQWT